MEARQEVGSGPENYHPKTEFRLEPPTGRSKSFRIRYKSPDTDNKWKPLILDEIKVANDLLKKGTVDAEHTKDKLKEILSKQYTIRDKVKKKPAFVSKNIELVEKMWEEKYPRRRQRKLKRPEESLRDLKNAAESCGMHPLDTCDLEDLQTFLDETLGSKPNIHSRKDVPCACRSLPVLFPPARSQTYGQLYLAYAPTK